MRRSQSRSVDCVKTPDHCDEILRSRAEATNVLGLVCRGVAAPPPTWVQMNTAHIYGDPPGVWCDPDSPTGRGLAPTVGIAWEKAFAESLLPQQRGVVLRTTIVIGRNRGAEGGALPRLVPLARWGLGGPVGSGRQGMSWIHEFGLNRLIERGLADDSTSGVSVGSSPHPVSNAEFMRSLRRAVPWPKVPPALPAPARMVRINAPLLMRTDPELAIHGRYMTSRRLERVGFAFSHPRPSEALAACEQGRRIRDGRRPATSASEVSVASSRSGRTVRGAAGTQAGAAPVRPERLVCIDETRAKTNTTRSRGRVPRGDRLLASVPHGHSKRTAFLPAVRATGPTASLKRGGAASSTAAAATCRRDAL